MRLIFCVLGCVCLSSTLVAGTASLVQVDFAKGPAWGAPHHLKDLVTSPNGTSFTVTGEDPWLVSPIIELPKIDPKAKRLQFTLKTKPVTTGGTWELFYAKEGQTFTAGRVLIFKPLANKPPFDTYRAEVPVTSAISGKMRFRLDPPGGDASFTVQTFQITSLTPLWTYETIPPPPLVIPAATKYVIKGPNDSWELRHDPNRMGAFRYLANGKSFENIPDGECVYLDRQGQVRTLDWSQAKTELYQPNPKVLYADAMLKDADGRIWHLMHQFVREGSYLRIITHIDFLQCNLPTVQVLHLPVLNLLVDRASQGRKHQALLAGVEYLSDEPSSNDKEIRTFEHNRLIPDETNLTAPIAVFTGEQNFFAFQWGQAGHGRKLSDPVTQGLAFPAAVVFDTPDRVFKSGGHLLGFWMPAVGKCRTANDRAVYHAFTFSELTHNLVVTSGVTENVADVLGEIVRTNRSRKLSPVDSIDTQASLATLAHGWLDSQIRDGLKVRHAINGNSFPAHHVADAPCLMQYLATQLTDKALAKRLRETAAQMLAAVPKASIPYAGVSHVRRPAPVLIAGDVPAFLDAQAKTLETLAQKLASGKRMRPAPIPGKTDLWSTLGADHCNGFTSMELDTLLSAATWSGDEAAINRALACADAARPLYHGTVPRGAQPWEMPLHTPDIMASAHLTRVYTLAYLLRGDPRDLAEARHWADSGLAFVSLDPPFYPTPRKNPVGAYSTCAVMGATHWVAPNWIGRPVQWCGLVYSAALYDLARVDASFQSFWHHLAVGITHSGMRQTYTEQDDPRYVGLLPDSWNLRAQTRFWCPINPGTVEENLAEALAKPFYAVRACGSRALVHAAGNVTVESSAKDTLRIALDLWPESTSTVVLTRLTKAPTRVTFRGATVPFTYLADRRVLLITVPASAKGPLVVTGYEL